MATLSGEGSEESQCSREVLTVFVRVHFFAGWGVLAAGSMIPHTFLDA